MNEPIRFLRSRTLVLPTENVDTDQIIPARFLTVTTREGLAEGLFADWRFDADGRLRPDSPFDRPESRGAQILVAGRNFGCGSSREHAVWALAGCGLRAVISTSLADIFRRNALKNGLLAVEVDAASHATLLANPGAEIEIDIATGSMTLPPGGAAGVTRFTLEPFARRCLLSGMDELELILSHEPEIAAFEKAHERGASPS